MKEDILFASGKKRLAILCATGLAAGLLNGFLGTGGGIVLMFVFAYLDSKRENPDGNGITSGIAPGRPNPEKAGSKGDTDASDTPEPKIPDMRAYSFRSGAKSALRPKPPQASCKTAENRADRETARTRERFASVVFCSLILSVVSAAFYLFSGAFRPENALRFTIPAIVGGLAGSFLLSKLKTRALELLFSAVLVIGGIIMLI